MKITNRILSLFFLLVLAQTSHSQNVHPTIDSLIHLISIESYQSHFDSLRTNEFNNRKVLPTSTQSSDHDACRDYIFRQFQKYLSPENVYMHHFYSGNHAGLANVIGFKKGSNPSAGIWVVGAHYDSNNNKEDHPASTIISPGANDNGTGIAAILEMARIISEIETEASILFAAWDFEEYFTNGFPTGSNEWANEFIKKKKASDWENLGNKGIMNINDLNGNLNFDMFGNPQIEEDEKPLLWICYARNQHLEFAKSYTNTLNAYIPEIKTVIYGRLILSDHYAFASKKIPAIENLESGFKYDAFYHTYSDNIENKENIDFDFATKVTRGGFAFLLEHATAFKPIRKYKTTKKKRRHK